VRDAHAIAAQRFIASSASTSSEPRRHALRDGEFVDAYMMARHAPYGASGE
jgi:hypothetical protein